MKNKGIERIDRESMKNDYVEYYGEQNISPVKQDIDNLQLHLERRCKLYRQCGIPQIAFRDAEMLEVGPGGGYNTLAFFEWGCKHIDLVEPNPKGREDIKKLFLKHGIRENKYTVFSETIENYLTKKKYDIIIAEGFVPCLPNSKEVIECLCKLLAKNGILVITCYDHVGFFVEGMKRLLGYALIKNIDNYDEKVDCLVKIFEEQLMQLKGVSRYTKDWVQDQILSPVLRNGYTLSMGDAISLLDKNFEVLGASPNIFTDYSWYKDTKYDYKKIFLKQFNEKRLSLLLAGMEEICLDIDIVKTLVERFENIRKLADQYEQEYDNKYIVEILEEMDIIQQANAVLSEEFVYVFKEIKTSLENLLEEKIEMKNYPHFFKAFGRSQQYISFMKKG